MVADASQPAATMMTRKEARECMLQIRASLRDCRMLLLDMHERQGWRVLGYSSWVECVRVEFGQSWQHLYRLLHAAQVEQELKAHGAIAGDEQLRERYARELGRLDTAEERAEVYREAAADGQLSYRRLQAAVTARVEPIERASLAAEKRPSVTAAEDTPRPAVKLSQREALPEIREHCRELRELNKHLGRRKDPADAALEDYLKAAHGE